MNTDRIEKKILLQARRSRVWRAISDSKEFGEWFGVEFEGPFEAGKTIRGVIGPVTTDAEAGEARKQHEGLPFEIAIERIEPERLFSFRWHPHAIDRGRDYSGEPTTLVEFILEEVSNAVLLTVTESGFDAIPLERRATAFTANDKGWGMVMKMIEGYIARTP